MAELPPTSPVGPAGELRWARGVFVVVAVLAALVLMRGWTASVLDRHEARQVQTLLSAQWIRAEGASLAYPLPLFGPPWSAPMEFPLYQTLVAWVSGATGCSLETCGRGVSVAAFAATLPAVWGLLGLLGISRAGRWLALSVFVSAPVFLFYARTVLIESTALGLAVWFLYAFARGVRGGDWRWWSGAALLGALAAAVKITTLAPFGALAVVFVFAEWRRRSVHEFVVPVLVPAAAVLGAAWAWVAFGDAVKLTNPYSAFLSSAALSSWNFGTLAQRGSAAFWSQLQLVTTHSVLAEGALWLGVVATALAARRARGLAMLLAGAFFVGPLLFANLYFVHDYYSFASAPFLTVALGVLLASAWESPSLSRWVKLALAVGVLGAQFVEYDRAYGGHFRTAPAQPPEICAVVRAATAADDVVLIGGWDWNATLPYFAERRALMLRAGEIDWPVLETMTAKIGMARLSAVIWRGPEEPPAKLRAWWQEHLGVLGTAAVRDGDLRLFANPRVLARLPAAFSAGAFRSAKLELLPAAQPWDGDLKEQPWTQDGTPGPAVPAPFKARSFHGCGVYVTGGERRIIAHAVTELFIHPPVGAHRIVAEFRMLPEAYNRAEPGDGADVEIFEEVRGGARRRLFRRHLEPAKRAEDRGDQLVELTGFAALEGDLVFAVTPGAAGRADFDWCDWKRIAVE